MCPGVGKTYAMLETARRELAAGRDVVIGYVETHGRKETDALADWPAVTLAGLSATETSPWAKAGGLVTAPSARKSIPTARACRAGAQPCQSDVRPRRIRPRRSSG